MGAKIDHTVVESLVVAAEGTDEDIIRAVTRAGIDQVVQVIFTEMFLDFDPGPGQSEGLAISYDVNFSGIVFSHHVNVDRDGPSVRRGTAPDAPLRVRHCLPQFLGLYRAVLGEQAAAGTQQMLDALLVGAEGGSEPLWLRGLRGCFDDTSDLTELAARMGTDKWGVHWYAKHYDRLFRSMRHRAVRLLEIGVGGSSNPRSGGASLAMWKRYFRRGQICGIDLRDRSFCEQQRVRVFRGDQSDRDFLESVMDQIGPVDIVIDDGSHRCADVLASFELLFGYLRPGGVYAVEDLHTSYWPGFGGSSVDLDNPRTTMGYLKSLADGIHYEDFVPAGSRLPSFTDRHVVGVHFFRNLAIVEKGTNADGPDWVVPEALRLSADAVAAATGFDLVRQPGPVQPLPAAAVEPPGPVPGDQPAASAATSASASASVAGPAGPATGSAAGSGTARAPGEDLAGRAPARRRAGVAGRRRAGASAGSATG